MQYKAYATRQNTPLRMARKRARQEVFVANKKMAKQLRKAARLARKNADNE